MHVWSDKCAWPVTHGPSSDKFSKVCTLDSCTLQDARNGEVFERQTTTHLNDETESIHYLYVFGAAFVEGCAGDSQLHSGLPADGPGYLGK